MTTALLDEGLHRRISDRVRQGVLLRLGPNALLIAMDGGAVHLSGGEADAIATIAVDCVWEQLQQEGDDVALARARAARLHALQRHAARRGDHRAADALGRVARGVDAITDLLTHTSREAGHA
ncbi:hypothetical protein [Thermomonospora cellulosilytica]|uniref:Uncharacterized protein n=1 Tax=Thermomonospora cellulosilytica TaxID=1411118 RepID=A0A7W3N1Y9_9ACTN|nr:hypothetical protein [Thermomonospora cellulosilytica]MBA9006004.1 hypothetical protein [Thermomonospora cellulosilytica]